MQVGLDTFSIRELKLSGVETLDWLKQHEFAGALFGGLGAFSAELDPAELKEAREYADSLELYTEVSAPNCNPHQVRRPLEEHRSREKTCGGHCESLRTHSHPW